MRTHIRAIAVLALVTMPGTILQVSGQKPSGPCGQAPNAARDRISRVMYLDNKPRDAAQCSMSVMNGRVVVASSVTNPALSCPDMFSWKLFAEVVGQEFWVNWAADNQIWPGVCDDTGEKCSSRPLPLCKAGNGANCCDPDAKSNPGYNDKENPAKLCPYFPGDHIREAQFLREAQPPSKARFFSFASNPQLHTNFESFLAGVEPGKQIRESMAELVFRNRELWNYTFRNDLYNVEGLASIFKRNADNASSGYHVVNGSSAITEIDYPIDSIMIKSNWISKEVAQQIGIKEDPEFPFIKMKILSPVTDNNGTILKPGEHWLVAFHISSKDIPNWVWATFEHVNNPGRCDYTGCEDSFGYASDDKVASDQAHNFTFPHTTCDNLPIADWQFDLSKPYSSGTRSTELRDVLNGLGIGIDAQNCTEQSCTPSRRSKGWLSYRLKGAQVSFTDSTGHPSRLGNSVTEAGFVNTSSCMTCHARASVGGEGQAAIGVFVNQLGDSGFVQSSQGIPNPDWFHVTGTAALQNLQTDFVWGFLFAKCKTQSCKPEAQVQVLGIGLTEGSSKNQPDSVRARVDKH